MDDNVVEKIYEKNPKIIHPVVDIILGVYHQYPLCCIASFAWKTATNNHSKAESEYTLFGRMVPCKFHVNKRETKIVKSGFDLDDFYD